MDQQLFTLARRPAVAELLGAVAGTTPVSDGTIAEYAGYTTMIFMIGWATGGLVFGVLGDRIGRVKTMIVTILFYSVFTGLSALSTGIFDFSLYRFLTGLGVGGQFAVGVALVADGFEVHIPRGYIYFAMAFAAAVEAFNVVAGRARRQARVKHPGA